MKKPICAATCLILATFVVHAADQSMDNTTPANTEITTDNTQANADNTKANADNTETNTGNTESNADNTKINKRDRHEQALTPLDQSNTKEDLKITQEIRKSIMATEFSANAKNIKIITRNGNVTLRGPVNSSTEKEEIVKLAKAVAGTEKLNNQLDVK